MASRFIFRLPIRQRPFHTTPYRTFTTTPSALLPRKGSQDRESIDTEPTEYSKSGTDSESAAQEEAAFDPNNTKPETEKDVAGQGQGKAGNPLEVSPANPEVSKQKGETEGGAENSGKDSGSSQSRHGSPKKAGKV